MIRKLNLLNAEDFKTLHQEAFDFNDITPDPAIINSTEDIDWQDELYQNALQQNHQISLSGGGEKSTFYVSTSFVNQEGLIESTKFNRGSLRLNSSHQISERISIKQNLTIAKSTDNFVNVDNLADGVLWAPPTLPVFDENGIHTVVAQPFARTNPIGLRAVSYTHLTLPTTSRV